jgi:hypothetical protein
MSTMRRTVGLFLAVVLFSGKGPGISGEGERQTPTAPATAAARPGEATSRWIALMATYHEPRASNDVQMARTVELVAESKQLIRSLPVRQAPSQGLILRPINSLLSDYRSVWKADRLDRDAWAIRLARIRQLSLVIADAWRPALSAVNAGPVSDDLILFLISDVAERFPAETFDPGSSDAALGRLATVPPDAAQSLASVLNMGRAHAAVLVVQNRDFFGSRGFDRPAFEAAVARILSSRR